MSLVCTNMPEDEMTVDYQLTEMTKYLDAIFSGQALIAFHSDGSCFISEDPESDLANLSPPATLRFEGWDNL